MDRFIGLLGVVVMVLLALCLSYDRTHVRWKLVVVGIVLQCVLAGVILRMHGWDITLNGKVRHIPGPSDGFHYLGEFVNNVIQMSQSGIDFVFGRVGDAGGPWGFIFAVKVLPIIIFFSALMSVLYYLGVMQRVVAALAWALRRTLRVTGAEATCMAANIFIGQTEAPLTVRPLIPTMTRAQLMLIMLGGFAHIAGSVLGAYVMMLGGDSPAEQATYATHLIGASLMSAPAAFVMARIIMPETEVPPPEDPASVRAASEEDHANLFDAAAGGATTGLKLALNIGAMLIAFVALVALVNWPIHAIGEIAGIKSFLMEHGWVVVVRGEQGVTTPGLSLQVMLGWLFAPLAWTLGVPWGEAFTMGGLLGEKLILTEFVAYSHLGEAKRAGLISSRTAQIGAYALCGFANFASIAIQIGGLSVLAPRRRKEFARLALRAMLGGALATQMTASIAGLFIK